MRLTRRGLLAASIAGAGLAQRKTPLIDTHLEVWTFDPRFPFHHPERPDLKRVPVEAPIENEVAELHDFRLKYAVLINPRFYGWDNSYISYSLHRHPKLFVAHGLIDPLDPNVVDRLRYWIREHGFQGMRFSPIYHPAATWLNSKEHYPLWREAERLQAVFNFYILPQQMPLLEDMAGRFPGVKVVIDHLGKPDLKQTDPWADFRKMFRLKRSYLRRVRAEATDLGDRIPATALGVAHGPGTGVCRTVSGVSVSVGPGIDAGRQRTAYLEVPRSVKRRRR